MNNILKCFTMTCSEDLTWIEKSCGCFTTLAKWYTNFRRCFQSNHAVHPQEPKAPFHSEFFIAESHQIRIIHIKPNNVCNETEDSGCNKAEQKRKSYRPVSEEYWFTRWNKPLQSGVCNCSFRNSQRISNNSEQLSFLSNTRKSFIFTNETKKCDEIETLPNTPTTLDTYVEKLVSVALLNAYKSMIDMNAYKPNFSSSGIVNLSFDISEDEVDSVQLRNKSYKFVKDNEQVQLNKPDLLKSYRNNILNNVIEAKNQNCDKHSEKSMKPIILLLHGIGSSAEVWLNVLNCLVNAGHEVLAPDMLGHGFSSVPSSSKAYKFSNLLKDTIAIFDKYIGCSELRQCIVIGHSFGCSLAGALARYRAQQIVQLVLISGGGPTPLAPPVISSEIYLYNCLQVLLKPLLVCGMRRTLFYSSRGKHFETCDSNTAVPKYVLHYISRGQCWPEGDAAFHRRILIPTLLVHGLQDEHVTLVQQCEMERTIPRSFLEVIPTAAHMAMLETPDQLCHMLLCFINWWTK